MSTTLDRDAVAARVSAFPRNAVDRPDLKHAAVTVCVVEDDDVPALLITRRAARMRKHAGQWALPGGRVDEGETALDAALRELDEELGLRLGPDSVLGWLDDYPTRSGYVISPVVLWAGAEPELRPAPDEVLAVYRIGLHALRDGEARAIRIPESDRPVLQVPLGNDLIHAPTGAVLHQFSLVALHGRAGERVDHYEQPVFAWR